MWFSMNVRHVCDGADFGRFGMYRATVLSETSMPSFRSSPCTRAEPQVELASDIS